MNALRNSIALRGAAALIALVAWIVISHHCAIATAFAAESAAEAQSEPSCCHAEPQPASDTPAHCPQMPNGCCNTLKISLPADAKIPHPAALDLPLPALYAAPIVPPVLIAVSAALPSTGPPPDFPAFVELVLNRSLLSHAPPARA